MSGKFLAGAKALAKTDLCSQAASSQDRDQLVCNFFGKGVSGVNEPDFFLLKLRQLQVMGMCRGYVVLPGCYGAFGTTTG